MCTEADLPELRRFQERFHGDASPQADLGRTRWLFADNPRRPAEGPALWISRRAGEIVAVHGSIPFLLKVGEEHCRAAWSVDVAADPRVRGSGIPHQLADAARHGVRLTCGLGLSEAGYRFALRRGFADLGTMPLHVLVVDARRFVETFGRYNAAVRVALPLLLPLTWLARIVGRTGGTGTRLQPVAAFDHRADAVWREAASAYPVLTVRDATWLRWRFDEAPQRSDYQRYYLLDGERAVGYLVLREATVGDAMPVLEIVDYLAAPRHLRAVLVGAAEAARRRGAAAVLCRTQNHRARWRFRLLGWSRRPSHIRVVTRAAGSDPIGALVSDRRAWFLTAADSDIDLG